MPITYDPANKLAPPARGELRYVEIDPQTKTIRWRYETYNSAGKKLGEYSYVEPFTQALAEDPAYAAVYAAVKAHGYRHYADAGMPPGGTVT